MDVRQLAALAIFLLLAVMFAVLARRQIARRRPTHVSIVIRTKRG